MSEDLLKAVKALTEKLEVQEQATAKIIESNESLRNENLQIQQLHQQQMKELLSKSAPEPAKPSLDEMDFDLSTKQGIKEYTQYIVSQSRQPSDEIQSKLDQLSNGVADARRDQFLTVAESELRIPAAQLLSHKNWDEYLVNQKNPVNNKSYKDEFEEANSRGDVSAMTNIVKQFAATDLAKDTYRDITGQDFLPMQSPSNGAGHSMEDVSDPQLSEVYKQIEKETYGEHGSYEEFMNSLNDN